jgi:hypothetical protein
MGLIQVGSAWSRTSKKGNKFLSISLDMEKIRECHAGLEKIDLMVFPNKKEWTDENPKRPGFQVCAKEEDFAGQTEVPGTSEGGGVDDDDIPF